MVGIFRYNFFEPGNAIFDSQLLTVPGLWTKRTEREGLVSAQDQRGLTISARSFGFIGRKYSVYG